MTRHISALTVTPFWERMDPATIHIVTMITTPIMVTTESFKNKSKETVEDTLGQAGTMPSFVDSL